MTDENINISRNGIWRRYGHLILLAAFYSLLGGIGLGCLDMTRGYSMVFTTPLVVASIVIISFWTVFGPSSYWVSFLVGQMFGMAITLGCAAGVYIAFWREFDDQFFSSLVIAICFVPTATVAVQIPLWIFRGLFGWRFRYRNDSTTSSLSLRDLFLITLVFAIAVTAPQYAASLGAAMSVQDIEIGNDTFVRSLQPDGSTSFEQKKVSAANIDKLRAEAKAQATSMFNQAALSYSAMLAVISLLTVPCLWFVFRIRSPAIACLFNVGYAAIFYFLVAVIFSLTNGLAFFFNQVSLWVFIVIGVQLIGFVLPMAISRRCGFRLTMPRDRESTVGLTFQ